MENYETYIIEYEGRTVRLVDASTSNHARKHANAILTARKGSYKEVQDALNSGLKIEVAAPLEANPVKKV